MHGKVTKPEFVSFMSAVPNFLNDSKSKFFVLFFFNFGFENFHPVHFPLRLIVLEGTATNQTLAMSKE